MQFQAAQMYITHVDGVEINSVVPCVLPPGMKVVNSGVGFNKYNGRVKIEWSFNGTRAILSKIYITDTMVPGGGRLVAEQVHLPNPEPTAVLIRSEKGLLYGSALVFECEPDDKIVVGYIFIDNESTAKSNMSMM
jgi:hypothetical protein